MCMVRLLSLFCLRCIDMYAKRIQKYAVALCICFFSTQFSVLCSRILSKHWSAWVTYLNYKPLFSKSLLHLMPTTAHNIIAKSCCVLILKPLSTESEHESVYCALVDATNDIFNGFGTSRLTCNIIFLLFTTSRFLPWTQNAKPQTDAFSAWSVRLIFHSFATFKKIQTRDIFQNKLFSFLEKSLQIKQIN